MDRAQTGVGMEESKGTAFAPYLTVVEGDSQREAQSAERQAARYSPPVVTFALLAVICVVFAAMVRVGHGDVMEVARQFGDKESDLIRAGQWWRLITPIFLHGSWLHLIVNGLSLLWFGGQMERLYGARRYLLIFMVAGIAGNLLSYLLLPSASLGASGALFGLIGAGIVFPLRFRALIPKEVRIAILRQLVPVALINLAISFSPGIDRWAHFGGFLGGGFAALFLIPAVLDDRPPNRIREAALSLMTFFILAMTFWAAWCQWRIARSEAPQETLVYKPAGKDPWWSFQLPPRWRQLRTVSDHNHFFAAWATSDGAMLQLLDDSVESSLGMTTDRWFAQQKTPPQPLLISGQPAVKAMVSTPQWTEELCKITAYDHVILDFILVSPQKSYPAAHQDYEQMLASIRFLHSPPVDTVHALPSSMQSPRR